MSKLLVLKLEAKSIGSKFRVLRLDATGSAVAVPKLRTVNLVGTGTAPASSKFRVLRLGATGTAFGTKLRIARLEGAGTVTAAKFRILRLEGLYTGFDSDVASIWKVWDGETWAPAIFYFWDGTTWIATDTIGDITVPYPVAAFTISNIGRVYTMDPSSSIGVPHATSSYVWDWGNPAEGVTYTNASTVTHTFKGAGTFIITLLFKDVLGRTSSVSHTVVVT